MCVCLPFSILKPYDPGTEISRVILLILVFKAYKIATLVTQVELVLGQHPGISSVVVIGLQHTHLGEMVVACVRIRENWKWVDVDAELQSNVEWNLSSHVLKEHCRRKGLTGSVLLIILLSSPSITERMKIV